MTLKEHKGLIFSVKWNDKGNYLLTAGIDQVMKTEKWWNAILSVDTYLRGVRHLCVLGVDVETITLFGEKSVVMLPAGYVVTFINIHVKKVSSNQDRLKAVQFQVTQCWRK